MEKFKVGDAWRTSGNKKAMILWCGQAGFVASVEDDYAYLYTASGKCVGAKGSNLNLIEPWVDPAPEKPVSELWKAFNACELWRIDDKAGRLLSILTSETERLSVEVEALKRPQEAPGAPKPTEKQEYFVNVWRYKTDGEIFADCLDTKEDAERNIMENDQDRWNFIRQYHGTFEVEK